MVKQHRTDCLLWTRPLGAAGPSGLLGPVTGTECAEGSTEPTDKLGAKATASLLGGWPHASCRSRSPATRCGAGAHESRHFCARRMAGGAAVSSKKPWPRCPWSLQAGATHPGQQPPGWSVPISPFLSRVITILPRCVLAGRHCKSTKPGCQESREGGRGEVNSGVAHPVKQARVASSRPRCGPSAGVPPAQRGVRAGSAGGQGRAGLSFLPVSSQPD